MGGLFLKCFFPIKTKFLGITLDENHLQHTANKVAIPLNISD